MKNLQSGYCVLLALLLITGCRESEGMPKANERAVSQNANGALPTEAARTRQPPTENPPSSLENVQSGSGNLPNNIIGGATAVSTEQQLFFTDYIPNQGYRILRLDKNTGKCTIVPYIGIAKDFDSVHGLNVDGNRIYFRDDERRQIYRMSFIGTNIEAVIKDSVNAFQIDNGWVYFSNDNGIYRQSTDDIRKELVSSMNKASEFAVVDGWIYFISSQSGAPQLYKIQTDGQSFQKLTQVESGVRHFNIHKDRIYYETQNKLFVMDVEGKQSRQVMEQIVGNKFVIDQEGWIYYSYNRTNGENTGQLRKVRVDGSSDTRLIDDDIADIQLVEQQIMYKGRNGLHFIDKDGKNPVTSAHLLLQDKPYDPENSEYLIIPGYQYYVLHSETIVEERQSLHRYYDYYDGVRMEKSTIVDIVELPYAAANAPIRSPAVVLPAVRSVWGKHAVSGYDSDTDQDAFQTLVEKKGVLKRYPSDMAGKPIDSSRILLVPRKLAKENLSDLISFVTQANDRLQTINNPFLTVETDIKHLDEKHVEQMISVTSHYRPRKQDAKDDDRLAARSYRIALNYQLDDKGDVKQFNLSIGTTYNHFYGEEDLYQKLRKEQGEQVDQAFAGAMDVLKAYEHQVKKYFNIVGEGYDVSAIQYDDWKVKVSYGEGAGYVESYALFPN